MNILRNFIKKLYPVGNVTAINVRWIDGKYIVMAFDDLNDKWIEVKGSENYQSLVRIFFEETEEELL